MKRGVSIEYWDLDVLMEDDHIKQTVLEEFGFGHAKKKKVVEWGKNQIPNELHGSKKSGFSTFKFKLYRICFTRLGNNDR
ncbi:hypothetical protein [Domibacillus enclensis]|uniref:Uncharacterized protein n=1 Tax=Domibacillus enclensis TaxID=1017273 RepID=A0A1N6NUL2_9BACI|nr:hypothetical protein [Domibacillus enclensis]OXS80148.1 hypothetical protein B1B05_01320 [Domibacillus enclensis]SIP95779.1 hypothetical protein SAMN05443094_101279 [Domibacillus enclensis]